MTQETQNPIKCVIDMKITSNHIDYMTFRCIKRLKLFRACWELDQFFRENF